MYVHTHTRMIAGQATCREGIAPNLTGDAARMEEGYFSYTAEVTPQHIQPHTAIDGVKELHVKQLVQSLKPSLVGRNIQQPAVRMEDNRVSVPRLYKYTITQSVFMFVYQTARCRPGS